MFIELASRMGELKRTCLGKMFLVSWSFTPAGGVASNHSDELLTWCRVAKFDL